MPNITQYFQNLRRCQYGTASEIHFFNRTQQFFITKRQHAERISRNSSFQCRRYVMAIIFQEVLNIIQILPGNYFTIFLQISEGVLQ